MDLFRFVSMVTGHPQYHSVRVRQKLYLIFSFINTNKVLGLVIIYNLVVLLQKNVRHLPRPTKSWLVFDKGEAVRLVAKLIFYQAPLFTSNAKKPTVHQAWKRPVIRLYAIKMAHGVINCINASQVRWECNWNFLYIVYKCVSEIKLKLKNSSWLNFKVNIEEQYRRNPETFSFEISIRNSLQKFSVLRRLFCFL